MKMQSRFTFVVLVLMMIFVSFLDTGQVFSQSGLPVWSSPELLGAGWWQSIVVDQRGIPHVSWYGSARENDGTDLLLYTVRDDEGNWLPPNDIVATGETGVTIRNTIQVSPEGILYLLYRHSGPVRLIAAPVDRGSEASSWQRPVAGDLTPLIYYNSLNIDDTGVIHIVFSGRLIDIDETQSIEINPCLYCHDLFYIRSVDEGKTWSQPEIISAERETGSDHVEIFQGDESGRLYITWDEGVDWFIGRGSYQDVRMVYSDDHGLTWSEPVVFNGDPDLRRALIMLDITELADGSIMAVWRYALDTDLSVYYQISRDVGETWSDPEVIPGFRGDSVSQSGLDSYELVTDLQGNIYFFGVGYDPETNVGPTLYQIEYRQGRWLRPVRVFYDASMKPRWPKAEVGPMNDLHLTWFVYVGNGENAADVGDLEVYYTHRPGNMLDQPVLAAYAPTATPITRATEMPTFAPTATSFPTVAPMDADLNFRRVNQDRFASETLLVAILAVGILCVGVLVIGGFRPKL